MLIQRIDADNVLLAFTCSLCVWESTWRTSLPCQDPLHSHHSSMPESEQYCCSMFSSGLRLASSLWWNIIALRKALLTIILLLEQLDLFTTLKYLSFLGVFLVFVGHRTLSHLSNTAAKQKTAWWEDAKNVWSPIFGRSQLFGFCKCFCLRSWPSSCATWVLRDNWVSFCSGCQESWC